MSLALAALLALGGMMAFNRRLAEREAALAAKERELAEFRVQVAAVLGRLHPPVDDCALTSAMGYRMSPMGGGEESLHRGMDLAGKVGTLIYASASGVVRENWPAPGQRRSDGVLFRGHPEFGGYITIDHGGGLITCYGHLSLSLVRTGQRVRQDELIGLLGATGKATGPHLHFEVVVDPRLFLGAQIARQS
jgi:murein DD-endopeptidase MepM/ murein hydrolase activator NlpD